MEYAKNATTAVDKPLPELEQLHEYFGQRLDQLDNALERLSRARVRMLGQQPREVPPPCDPETTPNGLLDALNRDIVRLERLRDIAREIADDMDRVA